MCDYFIGVDVGSFSVRSGLFLWDKSLKLVAKTEIKIDVFHYDEHFYEQSSDNIWQCICLATKKVVLDSNVGVDSIKGISFDATCSLVALDKDNNSLAVSQSNDNSRNIIMWMDHRANEENNFINDNCHKALRTVGGKISVEMQPPKLLWLKKNLPDFMSRVSSLFDLPDYLTYRATGSKIRSLCSVTCKWAFDAENNCWDKSFWESSNLLELCEDGFQKIGTEFCRPGAPIDGGLSCTAAHELGLRPGIRVPGSLIDAYAGMLGAISKRAEIVTIAGTSACQMMLISSPIYIDGIWGPFKNVLVDKKYVLEAGQSAVGILLDRILQFSSTPLSHEDVPFHLCNSVGLSTLMNASPDAWLQMNQLARDIHINPDFLGNRSPRSDPNIRGSMIGISLDNSASYTSKVYLAAVHGLAYGFKEIIGELVKKSVEIDSIKVCGGLAKNFLYLKVLADVTGLNVTISPNEDLVLTGTALLNILDKVDIYDNNKEGLFRVIKSEPLLTRFHNEKFSIYLKIISLQMDITENK